MKTSIEVVVAHISIACCPIPSSEELGGGLYVLHIPNKYFVWLDVGLYLPITRKVFDYLSHLGLKEGQNPLDS